MKFGQHPSIPSLAPLPKQNRQLPEKPQLQKGELTKGMWEARAFAGQFKKQQRAA